MRLLLDECLDWRLARDIRGHDIADVRSIGWASLDDGALLRRAAGRYDVLIAVDSRIAFQQNIERVELAIVILRARRSTRSALRPLVPKLHAALLHTKPGDIIRIDE